MAPVQTIRIANNLIGIHNPCFLIAEAGINHNGNPELAKQLIDVASHARFDAIKFQTFRAENIITRTAKKAQYQKKLADDAETQYEMLKKLELSDKDFFYLSEYAQKKGILFLSSPFDPESIDLLERIGVAAYKIPSGEITNVPLLIQIAQTGKPIILSTGMANLSEIRDAMKLLKREGANEIILLHCVTSYPAPLEGLNLRMITELEKVFHVPVGFSDHTSGILAPIIARSLGACVIEKHFTLNKDLPGPDHKASLEPQELAAMADTIRTVDLALGQNKKTLCLKEREIKKIARKSLVASRDLPPGTTISEDMVSIKRPGTGIQPKYFNEILGKSTKQRIKKDTLLRWDMIE